MGNCVGRQVPERKPSAQASLPAKPGQAAATGPRNGSDKPGIIKGSYYTNLRARQQQEQGPPPPRPPVPAPAPAARSPRPAVRSNSKTPTSSNSSLPARNVRHGRDAYVEVAVVESGDAADLRTMKNKNMGELVSAKWVQRESGAALGRQTEREIINHRKLLHPNILRLLEVFTTDNHLVIVMEYMGGQQLAQDLEAHGPMDEARARDLFRQLVEAVGYAHRQNVYHRALSTSCLMTGQLNGHPTLKVCDFTYSKNALLDSKPQTAVGNFAFTPPELLMAARDDAEAAGRASDIWACGVVLFQMLTCRLPFEDPKEPGALTRVMARAIVGCTWDWPPGTTHSPECTDLLRRIFVKNPQERATSQQILEHPWLTAQAALPQEEPATVSHQSPNDIMDIISRARSRRAASQGGSFS